MLTVGRQTLGENQNDWKKIWAEISHLLRLGGEGEYSLEDGAIKLYRFTSVKLGSEEKWSILYLVL